MINLIHGDCLEEMKKIPDKSIDLILCDPPYGKTAMTWDKVLPSSKLWEQYNRIIKPTGNIILFSSGTFTIDLINSNRKAFRYRLVWSKNVPTGMASAKDRPMKYYEELCIFGKPKATYNPIMKPRVGKGKACYNYDHYCGPNNHLSGLKKIKKRYDPNFVQPSDLLEFNTVPNRRGKLHPTEKPVDLLEWLVKTYSNPGDTVLDNCMGAGGTGVACIGHDRNFIGIEKSKKYFDVAQYRLTVAMNSKELFNV